MTQAPTAASRARRDRRIVIAALAAIGAVAWIYIVAHARILGGTGAAAYMRARPLTALDMLLLLVTWTVTMIGIMLPSAVQPILGYAAEAQLVGPEESVLAQTAMMGLGYLAVWTGFGVVAALGASGLHAAELLTPDMASTNPVLSGGLLVAAGLYQLTATWDRLLKRCREPRHFLHRDWRAGSGGAFTMGLEHGAYSLGCCFLLMCVLVVGGLASLPLIAAVTLFMLVETTVPFGDSLGFVSGPLMILAGAVYVILVP